MPRGLLILNLRELMAYFSLGAQRKITLFLIIVCSKIEMIMELHCKKKQFNTRRNIITINQWLLRNDNFYNVLLKKEQIFFLSYEQ